MFPLLSSSQRHFSSLQGKEVIPVMDGFCSWSVHHACKINCYITYEWLCSHEQDGSWSFANSFSSCIYLPNMTFGKKISRGKKMFSKDKKFTITCTVVLRDEVTHNIETRLNSLHCHGNRMWQIFVKNKCLISDLELKGLLLSPQTTSRSGEEKLKRSEWLWF